MHICPHCDKEIKHHLKRHTERCSTNIIEHTCEFCEKIYTGNKRFGLHRTRCPNNPNRRGHNTRTRKPETWTRSKPRTTAFVAREGFHSKLKDIDAPVEIKPRKKGNQYTKARENGYEYVASAETRAKISKSSAGKLHTEKTKKKISEARIAYLQKHPDKVPYLISHYSRGPSYPEQYFDSIFTTKGLVYEKEKRISLYSLDFAFNDLMIDFEVNGSQHYTDLRIVESDKRRKAFLEELGWKQIVVDWREFKKLDLDGRTAWVETLLCQLKPDDASNKNRV